MLLEIRNLLKQITDTLSLQLAKKKCNRNLELASVECEQGIYQLYISDETYSRKIKRKLFFMNLPIYMIKNIYLKNIVLIKMGIEKHMFIRKFMQSK